MNSVVAEPPIAPSSLNFDLETPSIMGLVRYASVLDIAFRRSSTSIPGASSVSRL